MMSDQLVLAIDVGGSSVKSALVANGEHIVGNVYVNEIQSTGSSGAILNALAMIISAHLAKAKDVNRIAFAFPGPFNYEQGISLLQNQAKYDALYGLKVGANLKQILGIPTLEIRFRNDAEAAILGEALHGTGVPYRRLLGLTLGTGLGSAFVADRELITAGSDVPNHGWLYSFMFGNQRADDAFSTRGLLARLRERGIQATDIASAIRISGEEDHKLAEMFASFGEDLGTFLNPFVSEFRADAVLATGGITQAGDYFLPSLSQSLSVPVVRGMLGKSAALLGAAALYF